MSIFSPSAARVAASTARDWSYVDSWLKAKYAPRTPPPFERNPSTLAALLALVCHNESADEDRHQLSRIQEATLSELRVYDADSAARRPQAAGQEEGGGEDGPDAQFSTVPDGQLLADDLLSALEDGLAGEGKTALDATALMAVELGMSEPSPAILATEYVDLQGRVFVLEQMMERIDALQRYIDGESARMDGLLADLQGEHYRPASDLAKWNLELQRKVKATTAKLPELSQQLAGLDKSAGGRPAITVEHVQTAEEEYAALLAKKRRLDDQVKLFAGLPPDVEAAHAKLDALRAVLSNATQRRDAVFEGLVERESPVKTRRRP